MSDLIERLRRAAKLPGGWAISGEAADEIERLQSSLARHVDSVCALTTERDALRARIEGARTQHNTDSKTLRAYAAERDTLRAKIRRAPQGKMDRHECSGGSFNVVLGPAIDPAGNAEIAAMYGKRVALVVIE